MFRRFMIVCWVLLGVCVAGWIFVYDRADDAHLLVMEVFDQIDEHPAMELESSDESYVTTYEAIRDASGKTVADLLNDQKPLIDNRDRLRQLAGLFLSAGFYLLLWNIIWHIGHWIWMGRKNND